MNGEALQVLVRLLLHGSPESRRTAAEQLLREGEPDDWKMLVSTVCVPKKPGCCARERSKCWA